MHILTSVRHLVCASIFLATVVGVASAQKAGHIEIVGGNTVDWGTVAPAKLTSDIKVKNVGDSVLKILEVRPSCGCTVAPIDKSELQPGETATIHVTFDVSSRTGPTQKSITVHSSDPLNTYVSIMLKADVKRSLTFIPSNFFVVANGVKGVASQASPVRLFNSGETPFTVYPPVVVSGNVKAVFSMTEPKEVLPGQEVELQVMVTPMDDKSLFGEVEVKTSNPEYEVVNLSITGSIKRSDAPSTPADVPQQGTVDPHQGHGH